MASTTSINETSATGNPWIRRRQTYLAHALILFNLYGTLLSYGPYLEYYYTAQKYGINNVATVSSSLALRLFCVCVVPLPVAYCYLQNLRNGFYVLYLLVPFCPLIALLESPGAWPLILPVQGFQGLALGALASLGVLALGTHYKNNIPLASTIGCAAGFMGAVVHTGVAYAFLANSKHTYAYIASTVINAVTLCPAAMLIKRNSYYARLGFLKTKEKKVERPSSSFKNKSSLLSIVGLWLISIGLFVWPTYIILQMSHTPSKIYPVEATTSLLLMHGCGFVGAILGPLPFFRHRLGAVNIFICASFIAAASYVDPAWIPSKTIAMCHAPIYGLCLGVLLSLLVKVFYTITQFNRPEAGPPCHFDVGICLIGTGVSAALGIALVGLMMDMIGDGLRLGLTAVAGIMFCGTVCLAVGRFWGTGWKGWVIV
jgi:hypothetical protein